MRRTRTALAILVFSLSPSVVVADDMADVRAVVDDYLQFEGTDLAEQQTLMTSDSLFINAGRRQTDQAHNAMAQVAVARAFEEFDPDSQLFATAEDVIIRVYDGAAIASFYRHWDFIPSQKLLEATNGNPPSIPPQIVTLVLVKEGRDWKIALRHNSPLHPDN